MPSILRLSVPFEREFSTSYGFQTYFEVVALFLNAPTAVLRQIYSFKRPPRKFRLCQGVQCPISGVFLLFHGSQALFQAFLTLSHPFWCTFGPSLVFLRHFRRFFVRFCPSCGKIYFWKLQQIILPPDFEQGDEEKFNFFCFHHKTVQEFVGQLKEILPKLLKAVFLHF